MTYLEQLVKRWKLASGNASKYYTLQWLRTVAYQRETPFKDDNRRAAIHYQNEAAFWNAHAADIYNLIQIERALPGYARISQNSSYGKFVYNDPRKGLRVGTL